MLKKWTALMEFREVYVESESVTHKTQAIIEILYCANNMSRGNGHRSARKSVKFFRFTHPHLKVRIEKKPASDRFTCTRKDENILDSRNSDSGGDGVA